MKQIINSVLDFLLLNRDGEDGFSFTEPGETFLSCLAKNYEWICLTFLGKLVYNVLNLRNRYYCIKSIVVTENEREMGLTEEFWDIWLESEYNKTNLTNWSKIQTV